MRPWAPSRSGLPPAHDDTRITEQIRRFALLWLLSAVAVLFCVALAIWVSDHYHSQAARRAQAATATQLALARLTVAIERVSNDHLAYQISGDPADADSFRQHSADVHAGIADLRAAARAQGVRSADVPALPTTLSEISRWIDTGDLITAAAPGHQPLATGQPPFDRQTDQLLDDLAKLRLSLPAQSAAALASARTIADRAEQARKLAVVMGMLVMLLGGIRLVRQAHGLALEADGRREREESWREQIEAVLAWSVRAKDAATRSQLIGFASMAPKGALGASCFIVTEGAAAAHPSHGQPRLALAVDNAGDGLHVSVCFAEGRGDQHDHHALDLLLGHMSALWRTVLRQEALERAAGHDALTGLPNRRAFEAELRRRVALSRRRRLGFTLAMVDLDHFKSVNDTLGHPEGDAVLRRAGEAIRNALRNSDRIFRVGGEEFALILETTDPSGVRDLLERSREAVKTLGVEPAPGRRLSASIGWAIYAEDADERGDLIGLADRALYQAKHSGRDRVLRTGELDQAA